MIQLRSFLPQHPGSNEHLAAAATAARRKHPETGPEGGYGERGYGEGSLIGDESMVWGDEVNHTIGEWFVVIITSWG